MVLVISCLLMMIWVWVFVILALNHGDIRGDASLYRSPSRQGVECTRVLGGEYLCNGADEYIDNRRVLPDAYYTRKVSVVPAVCCLYERTSMNPPRPGPSYRRSTAHHTIGAHHNRLLHVLEGIGGVSLSAFRRKPRSRATEAPTVISGAKRNIPSTQTNRTEEPGLG